MTIHRVDNLFSNEELNQLTHMVDSSEIVDDGNLGRIKSSLYNIPDNIVYKMYKFVNDLSDQELSMTSASFVEYNTKYGQPNLPPHFDSDSTEFIIDFQLSANFAWDLGINQQLYPLQDNSAIVFNPNTNIHWRPHTRFEEGDYVRMLFFRFGNAANPSDYSHTDYSQHDEIFKDTREYRDSLKDRTVF